MENITTFGGTCPETSDGFGLEDIAREGARKMLQLALENEIQEFVLKHSHRKDSKGHRPVVKNGSMPDREVLTGLGPVNIRQPRVDDRKLWALGEERFSSAILPKFMRRSPSIDALIPILYLKGVSTNDFPTALQAILGDGVKGLSATNIVRLKQSWEDDHKARSNRSLKGKQYVYLWADGIYCNIRLETHKSCLLVLIAADSDGNKELVAVDDGFRESAQSWRELLLDLKDRGLTIPPKLAIGDGALGFWKALDEVYPKNKTAAVLGSHNSKYFG